MKAFLLGALALVPVAAAAQPSNPPAERITHLVIYGRDTCPRGGPNEIVICARRPDTERYRIPKAIRDQRDTGPESTSWAERAQSLEYVGRTGTNSCTPVGPGGSTGCLAQMMRDARRERQQPDDSPP